ncbi:MAG: hypothetical protein CMN20_10430 [Roseovarius sp.]|nr:hypothetical protein [Roseovarius sp.]
MGVEDRRPGFRGQGREGARGLFQFGGDLHRGGRRGARDQQRLTKAPTAMGQPRKGRQQDEAASAHRPGPAALQRACLGLRMRECGSCETA